MDPAARSQASSSVSQGTVSTPHLSIDPELDAGFHMLYQLEFAQARERFAGWEQVHPAEPLGPALEAAAFLYEEFYRKGVMTSEFFLDDNRLLGGIAEKPDADLEAQFAAAAQRSDQRAHQRLVGSPHDPDALFALTLTAGMRADDLFLIQKRQIESLRQLRDADRNARALLDVAPDTDDAYLALGASNYIIGCMPVYKRAFLWVGGIHGDKVLGMQQLRIAAANGHYLRAYAKFDAGPGGVAGKRP